MNTVPKSLALAAAAMLLTSVTPVAAPSFSAEMLGRLDPSPQLGSICGRQGMRGQALRARLQLAAAYQPAPAMSDDPVTLLPGLGNIRFRISTANDMAQRYFDQGLALTYGFNHAEAIRSFREAQRLDPRCAMCWWGEALAHGPNINAPMAPEVIARAVVASGRASTLKRGATPVERALIDALALRYSDDPKADRAALDRRYADAMLDVARRFPQQDDVALLAAEAVMDTRPWDYWEGDGRTPKGKIGEAIGLVETVLARSPDHPQAAHLYIHLMEASAEPARAEAAADRLARPLAPNAGHLVHMPGHLYFRVGRFADSIRVNVAAARVDEAYLARSKEAGIYRFGYYPHNVHFIVTSAQMAGDMETAIREARRLRAILNTDVSAAMPWVQPVDAAPYLAYAQFASPAEIFALPPPDARLRYATAIWHYARAVARAQQRDDDGFATELAAIREIRETTDFKPMEDQLVPASQLLRLAELVAAGRRAYAHGRYEEAVVLYEQAASLEDGIRYMEPPFWYYPVRQSLGAALFRAGRLKDARQAFLAALAQSPNNGWVLFGLAATHRALGDRVSAAAAETALERAWLGDRRWLRMDRL
ncbi:hypothetical protein CLG96_09140 [Sphingomonas oleivorans]|uniref:Tetratricopeptide repeat protein n=1 Tax=Sphingomonas oleivorans TaxID=1735121 RepID=A0A2T5FYG3_9SPHN|nr:tetratricopeptide repeat protein [Sphingomonas oleivorans]PTQ11583.1 hypothetical protein CLG96_09140 [Sphingomonas oleivorans]